MKVVYTLLPLHFDQTRLSPPPPPPTFASSLSVFLAASLNSIVIGCVSVDVYIRSGLLPVYKLDRGKISRAIFYQSELIH